MKDTDADTGAKARLRLWLRLLKTSRIIEAEVRENLRRDHGTTLPRFDVLAALYRTDAGLKMSELSGALRVSNGNVTGIVDRLVHEGMVTRKSVEGDRRAMRVSLTDQGRDEFADLAAHHEGWIDAIFAGISPEDAAALSDQLKSIITQLDERSQA